MYYFILYICICPMYTPFPPPVKSTSPTWISIQSSWSFLAFEIYFYIMIGGGGHQHVDCLCCQVLKCQDENEDCKTKLRMNSVHKSSIVQSPRLCGWVGPTSCIDLFTWKDRTFKRGISLCNLA